jgi:hypothetical protein
MLVDSSDENCLLASVGLQISKMFVSAPVRWSKMAKYRQRIDVGIQWTSRCSSVGFVCAR